MLVYILNVYEEHGPEEIVATLHAAEIPEIINRIFDGYVKNTQDGYDNRQRPSEEEWQFEEFRRRFEEGCRAGLERELAIFASQREMILAKLADLTAKQLISPHSINLQGGWGGLQLHIVELT